MWWKKVHFQGATYLEFENRFKMILANEKSMLYYIIF